MCLNSRLVIQVLFAGVSQFSVSQSGTVGGCFSILGQSMSNLGSRLVNQFSRTWTFMRWTVITASVFVR